MFAADRKSFLAALDRPGIYVANRAQMDTKVIQAVVDYASKQATAGTGRLLLAASDAARFVACYS